MTWLPADFAHPQRLVVPPSHHLRPIKESDVDVDYPAVMGSQPRLWTIFGEAWGWPRPSLTFEEDAADLARHEKEMSENRSFNYALLNEQETALLGCVYIDPPERVGADADISWWVVNDLVGTPLASSLDDVVPRWIERDWPFREPRFVGLTVTWDEWIRLPEP
jgi:RimJ/RimL family protein N-acetyltransferase